MAPTLRLVHLGPDEIELDLSDALVRAVWSKEGVPADTWEGPLNGPRTVSASDGWTYDVPFGHPFEAAAEVRAAVENVLAFDGEFWRSCAFQAPPAG